MKSAKSVSFVMTRAPLPSMLTTHRLSLPERSEMKAMLLPSGEKRGMQSHDVPLVMRRACAAGDRQHVEIAHQVEHDGAAIR